MELNRHIIVHSVFWKEDPLLLRLVLVLRSTPPHLALRIGYPQLAVMGGLPRQNGLGPGGAFDIQEIKMRESTRQAGATIDGDADVGDVVDALEQILQVTVGELVGDSADVQAVGRREHVLWGQDSTFGVCHHDLAAIHNLAMLLLDGLGGSLDVAELDVAESAKSGE